jgi:predicted dehydrogenase
MSIGFAVVGLGMGRQRAELITKTAGARLARVVDLNEQRARDAAAQLQCPWSLDIAEALGDPAVDVVMVMTPSGLHADLVIRSLQAGKHVITTKPMEVSVEACERMLDAQRASGKLLAVDFQERYAAANQKIKFALERGLIGRPLLAEARLKWHRSQAYYDAGGWRGTWKMDGGGALANQTIHCIDILCWLMGQPKRVIGSVWTLAHQMETEDLGTAIVEFAGGAKGVIVGTTTFPTSPYWGVEVHGHEGGVIAMFDQPHQWHFLKGLESRKDQLQTLFPHANVIEDMVSALTRGTPLVCDGEQGKLSVQLLRAIYNSSQQGGLPVEV